MTHAGSHCSTSPCFPATTIATTTTSTSSSSCTSSSSLSASLVFPKSSYGFRDHDADMNSSIIPFLWEDKPGVAKQYSKAELAAGGLSTVAADRGSSTEALGTSSSSASSSSSVSCRGFSASSSFADMDELANSTSMDHLHQQQHDNFHDHDVLGFFSARPLPPPPGRCINPSSRPCNSTDLSSSSSSTITAPLSSSSSDALAAAAHHRHSKVPQPLHLPLIAKVLPPFNTHHSTKKKTSHVQARLQDDPFWLAMVACTEEPFLPSQYQLPYTTSNPNSSTKSRHEGRHQKIEAPHKRVEFHQLHRRSNSLTTKAEQEAEKQHSSSRRSHGAAPSPSIPQKQIIKDAPKTGKAAILGADRRLASAPEWISCSPNPKIKHSHEYPGDDHDDQIDAFDYRATLISKRGSNRLIRAISHVQDHVQELPIPTKGLSGRKLLYADKAYCNRKSNKFFPDLLGCRSSSVVFPP